MHVGGWTSVQLRVQVRYSCLLFTVHGCGLALWLILLCCCFLCSALHPVLLLTIVLILSAPRWTIPVWSKAIDAAASAALAPGAAGGKVIAPMSGRVTKVFQQEGDQVRFLFMSGRVIVLQYEGDRNVCSRDRADLNQARSA